MQRTGYRSLQVLLLAVMVAGSSLLYGQFGRRFFIEQNDPPPTELITARWRFGTNGRIGHSGWTHNYPYSEQHLNQLISETTGVNVDVFSYRIVELGSDEVFDYPFAYVSEPGEMDLTAQEVENFRQFIDRGGFVLVDDFDGDHILQLHSQIRRAFPDRELAPVGITHPIFHSFYDLQSLEIMEPYVTGGRPEYFALLNKYGDIALIACWNNDLANFWDWIDEARYPLEPSTEAFRMGINFVIYAMTH